MADKIVSQYSIDVDKAKADLNDVLNTLERTDAQAIKAGQDLTKSFAVPLPSINALNAQVKSLESLIKSATDPAKIQQFNKELIVAKNTLSTFSGGTAIQKTAGQFNQLNFSVAQLTRELPAFTYSIQTGFLALSNNIPIFVDQLSRIRKENEALVASGQKPISLFKQLGSAIFSFQTILSVGILLLVTYGKEIGEFFSSLSKGEAATNKAKVSLEALNAAYDSKELKSGVKSLIELRNNVNLAQQGYLDKEKVLKQYNETLGKSFGVVTNLKDAEQGIIDNTSAYISSLIKREAANKIASDAADNLIKKTQLLEEREKIQEKLRQEELTSIKNIQSAVKNGVLTEIEGERQIANIKEFFQKQQITGRRGQLILEISETEKALQAQLSLINEFGIEASTIIGGDGDLKGAFTILNDEIAKLKSSIQDSLTLGQPVGGAVTKLKELEAQLERIKNQFDRLLTPLDTGFDLKVEFDQANFDAETKSLEESISQTTNDLATQAKVFEDLNGNTYKSTADLIKQVNDFAVKNNLNYLDTYREFLASGFKTFEEFEIAKTKVLSDEEKKRLKAEKDAEEISRQLKQGTIGLASTIEGEFFNLRRNELESNADLEIEKQQELLDKKLISEETFNARRGQILNKQAQVERELTLSQIKVQTALAIIRAAAAAPFPLNLPAIGFAIAEGAIQYGFASAQPLPKYAKGIDRIREGKGRGIDDVPALLTKDEAVIKASENMKYEGLSKAWNAGKLEPYLVDKFIQPAIEAYSKRMSISMNHSVDKSVRVNNSFNDKKIVSTMERNNRISAAMLRELRIKESKTKGRLWN